MRIVIQCCLHCLNLQFHGWWKGITIHPSCDFAVWIKCNRIKDSVPQNHGKKKVFALSCFRWLHANANKSSTTSVVRFTNKWLFWAESLRVLSHLPHLVRLNCTRVLCPSWCGLFGQVWMQQSHLGVHQKRTKQAYRDLLEEVVSAQLQTDSGAVRSWWESNPSQGTKRYHNSWWQICYKKLQSVSDSVSENICYCNWKQKSTSSY